MKEKKEIKEKKITNSPKLIIKGDKNNLKGIKIGNDTVTNNKISNKTILFIISIPLTLTLGIAFYFLQ